jgi:ABC-type uncharacterized transport system permease subunit
LGALFIAFLAVVFASFLTTGFAATAFSVSETGFVVGFSSANAKDDNVIADKAVRIAIFFIESSLFRISNYNITKKKQSFL